ncbi:MAG: BolA/IbaG family iron-sulfur metabolism protein [Candidatus Neomarinimicrobiota bacterium]|nr:BolA/IbaG family iron-sulfur metabolism protein [Candidatus Neomarinimicrobiota bacterium]
MDADKVRELIQSGIPNSTAEVIDTTGTNDHFSAVIISNSFEGLSLIEQHQMVYKSVGAHMTNEIHALEIKTFSEKKWKEKSRGK